MRRFAWLVLVVLAVPLSGCGGNPDTHEPKPTAGSDFRIPPAHGGSFIVSADAAFTDGLEILEVEGGRAVQISDVGLIGASANLEFLGASLSYQAGGTVSHQYLDGFPLHAKSLGSIVPAVGAELGPLAAGEHPPELLVGLQMTGSGVATRHGIFIDYLVDGQRFRAEFPSELKVCTRDVTASSANCQSLPPGDDQ